MFHRSYDFATRVLIASYSEECKLAGHKINFHALGYSIKGVEYENISICNWLDLNVA